MPNPAEIAELVVGGKRYGAWKSFWLRKEYGAGIGAEFEFTASEPIDATGAYQNWRIQPGDTCNIYLAGILALTGHVEVRQGSFNAREHGVMFRGRSNGADAVDSSAKVSGGQFRGYTFQQIAQALLQPTGVNLVIQGTSPNLSQPFPNFSIRGGETVHMAIERLARLRGMRITGDANGNYVASYYQQGGSTAELVEGRNLLEARAIIDVSRWYGQTDVHAQAQGSNSNFPTNDNAATATNPNAPSNRYKLIVLEEPGSAQDCKNRALHEMAFSGNAQIDCSCVVQGWQSGNGQLWDTAQTYTVTSPMLDLDRQLASRVVTYAQDSDNGTTTTIELCTPETLSPGANISAGGQGDSAYSGDSGVTAQTLPPS